MTIRWTTKAKALLLPFPGDEWTIAKRPARTKVPDGTLDVAKEVKRGLKHRLEHRYNAKGNHTHDTLGRALVDAWCARANVAFATEVLIAICKTPHKSKATPWPTLYQLRWDGQPWARLREHLACASDDARERAHALAAAARDEAKGELGAALAYAFCDEDWVTAELDPAIESGYGQLAVLAATRDATQLRAAFERLMTAPRYRFEEIVPHVPCVMRVLGDAGAGLIVKAAGGASSNKARKPWLEFVACYATPEARAFVKKHRS